MVSSQLPADGHGVVIFENHPTVSDHVVDF
jgi:hypothetical protein